MTLSSTIDDKRDTENVEISKINRKKDTTGKNKC